MKHKVRLQFDKWLPCGKVPAGAARQWCLYAEGAEGVFVDFRAKIAVSLKGYRGLAYSRISSNFPMLIEPSQVNIVLDKLEGRVMPEFLGIGKFMPMDIELQIRFKEGRTRRKLPDFLMYEMGEDLMLEEGKVISSSPP